MAKHGCALCFAYLETTELGLHEGRWYCHPAMSEGTTCYTARMAGMCGRRSLDGDLCQKDARHDGGHANYTDLPDVVHAWGFMESARETDRG